MSTSLTPSQNLGLGVGTAVIEGLLLQPTLYWKNAKALKLPFSVNPRIIYRGTGASMYNEMQMMGLQFGLTGVFQKMFMSSNSNKSSNNSDNSIEPEMTNGQRLASAMMGGVVSAVFTAPVELVMIQQQQFGGTMIGTPLRVIKTYGFSNKGMFRGVLPVILRDSIYVSGLLGVTPIIQRFFIEKYGMSDINSSICASMVGGMVAAVPSHPLDITKTCMQGDMGQVVYKGVRSTMKTLWDEGGITRMYHGCMWRTFNIIATVFIANECRIRFPSYVNSSVLEYSVTH